MHYAIQLTPISSLNHIQNNTTLHTPQMGIPQLPSTKQTKKSHSTDAAFKKRYTQQSQRGDNAAFLATF
jgi:hypothetical protein